MLLGLLLFVSVNLLGVDVSHRIVKDINEISRADFSVTAFYDPVVDEIVIGGKYLAQASQEELAYTVLHEMIHWTSHHGRLNRHVATEFKEEVVAELGCVYFTAKYKPKHANVKPSDASYYLNNHPLAEKITKEELDVLLAEGRNAAEFLAYLLKAEGIDPNGVDLVKEFAPLARKVLK